MRVLAISLAFLLSSACTAVLDPGRYQGGAGSDGGRRDAATSDGGDVDGGDVDGGGRDAGDRDGGSGDGGSEDGGGPTCSEAGFTCAPSAPAGWTGPIVLVSGPGDQTAPACPGVAPATEFATHSGLTAAPAMCACECTPPPSGTLTCGTVTLRTATNCFAVGTTHTTIERGQCKSISGLSGSGAWQASSSAFSSTGTCTANPTVNVPEALWDQSHRACGFGTADSCGAGVCVPPLETGQRLCVYVDGDASCPPSFPNALRTAEDIADDRGCSACTCGSVNGSCTGSLVLTSGCGGLPLAYASIPVGGCVSASSHPLPHSLQASFSPSASCPASSVSANGDATPQMARTVCCAP